MADPDKGPEAQALLVTGPQPGQYYRHYKGAVYFVLCRSVKEDTLEQLVTYQSVCKGFVWTRTLDNWNALVGDRPRFSLVRCGEKI